MSGAAGAGAAAAAAAAQAIKASGAIIKMEPSDFQAILSRQEDALVVMAEGGFLGKTYSYLTSYRGLIFYTKTGEPMHLPSDAELIRAEKIWIP